VSAVGAEWPVSSLSELADYNVGRTPSRSNSEFWDQSGDVVPWVTISDLPAYGTVLATKESVSTSAFERVFRCEVAPAGTLLMSFKLTIGRIATLGMPAVHNEAIISIYPAAGMDQRFLGYYLSQIDYTELQDRQIKGNTLNKAKIDRIPVPIPPEPEQKAIADILDVVRLAIRTNHEDLAATKALKHVVAHQIFSKGLQSDAAERNHGEELAGGWVHERIGDSHSVSSGGTPSRSVPEYWSDGAIPWVKTTEVDYSVITETSELITERGLDESAAKMVPADTVLLAMYGATRGKVAVLGVEAATNQACAAIQPDSNAVDSRYLYHYLAYQYDELRQMAHGGAQQNLSLDIVRDFPVTYPARSETQAEIVETLDALDDKARLHEARIPILETLFGSLLSGLISRTLSAADVDTSHHTLGLQSKQRTDDHA
jgi:type I restriction enzyme S subunit